MTTPSTLKREARITGAFYLLLAVSAAVGYFVVRSQVFVEDDAAATAAKLVEHENLARLGIAAEMTMVVSQVLVALWFYRLFRRVNAFAAASLAVFGFFNAVVGLVGAVFTATSLGTALGDSSAPGGDVAGTSQLLFQLRDATWDVGELSFGLWLVPMGYLVIKSGFIPRLIGYMLLVDAVAYLVSAYTVQTWPGGPTTVTDTVLLVVPGEFLIILYLLIRGAKVRAGTDTTAPSRSYVELEQSRTG